MYLAVVGALSDIVAYMYRMDAVTAFVVADYIDKLSPCV